MERFKQIMEDLIKDTRETNIKEVNIFYNNLTVGKFILPLGYLRDIEKIKKYVTIFEWDYLYRIFNDFINKRGVLNIGEFYNYLLFFKKNTILRNDHIKDYKKQNVGELAFSSFLLDVEKELKNKYPDIKMEPVKLSPAGSKAKYVNVKGNVVCGPKTSAVKTKSLDFYIKVTNIKTGKHIGFYITQKHTEGTGGAQNNQRDDIINTLDYAKLGNSQGTFVVAIIDGSYYENSVRSTIANNYLHYPNIIVKSADDFVPVLKDMVEKL